MKKVIAAVCILVLVAIQGCATTDEVGVKDAYIACGAADAVTTAVGISTGKMVEANPITKALYIDALGKTWGIVVPIIGMLWVIYYALDAVDEPVATGAVATVECGAAIHNLGFILGG